MIIDYSPFVANRNIFGILKQLQEVARLGSNVFEGLISTGELSAEDAFEVYTQKNAQIDYDAKKKELQNFYSE